MLSPNPARRKRKKKRLSFEDYMEAISTIREAPVEMSNEEVMEKVTETYGNSKGFLTHNSSTFVDYAIQLIVIVTIVLLFILTISFVSSDTQEKDTIINNPTSILIPGDDIVF